MTKPWKIRDAADSDRESRELGAKPPAELPAALIRGDLAPGIERLGERLLGAFLVASLRAQQGEPHMPFHRGRIRGDVPFERVFRFVQTTQAPERERCAEIRLAEAHA